ncbi:MAG: hypothetical protein AB1744_00750 [Candidatus Zixiibacteriota bacterium]
MSTTVVSYSGFQERQRLRWAQQALREFGVAPFGDANKPVLDAIENGELQLPPPPAVDPSLPD